MGSNKIERNSPCPCGSGKKYKKCCYGKKQTHGFLPVSSESQVFRISEAVLNLSEPLRKKYTGYKRTHVAVELAIIAWNLSLFPDKGHDEIEKEIIALLPEGFEAQDIVALIAELDKMINQKKKHYPNKNELILEHDLSITGDQIKLTVKVAPIGKESQ